MMTGIPPRFNPAALVICSMLAAQPVLAGEDTAARLSTEGARVTLSPGQPDEPIADAPAVGRYGAEGTEWILLGTGVAHDFDDNTDFNLNIGYSRFLVDDVEWLLELAGWYHNQEGGDALSLNPAMEFRWHFYNAGRTSVFANAGIGVLGATDDVPDMGTSFNLNPRIGLGLTHQIGADGTRLIAGLRWHHISNARMTGEAQNPARDAPMLYLQFAIPF